MRTVCLILLLAAPAQAGQLEAEHQRLHAEMESLAARGAWEGADRAYVALTELGVPLTWDDHWWGGQVALSLGNVNDAVLRFRGAEAIAGTEDLYVELGRLFAAYSLVSVRVARRHEEPLLSIADPPFDPIMLRTLDVARAALKSDRRYDGLLPLGQYEIAGTSFEVIGQPLVKVKAR
jgi:hypothetical protein